jgi:hypothetical protein
MGMGSGQLEKFLSSYLFVPFSLICLGMDGQSTLGFFGDEGWSNLKM